MDFSMLRRQLCRKELPSSVLPAISVIALSSDRKEGACPDLKLRVISNSWLALCGLPPEHMCRIKSRSREMVHMRGLGNSGTSGIHWPSAGRSLTTCNGLGCH